MAVPILTSEVCEKIKRLADEIYYSIEPCGQEKIDELDRLASPYEYMDFDRAVMCKRFKDYHTFKRRSKKAEAWTGVQRHAKRIGGLALMAMQIQ